MYSAHRIPETFILPQGVFIRGAGREVVQKQQGESQLWQNNNLRTAFPQQLCWHVYKAHFFFIEKASQKIISGLRKAA